MTKLAVFCPGQGAQAAGMATAWAAASPAAKAVLDTADRVLAERLRGKLSDLMAEGGDRLNRTDAAQPALLAAGIASWRGMIESGEIPSGYEVAAAAGLSLGEYTALCVAGTVSLEDAINLVAIRGEAMQQAAEATPSGMVALIGADESAAQSVCDAARGDGVLQCANFNAPGQIVISGDRAACDRAVKEAEAQSLRATPLSVAGAFHSPIMAPAAERLGEALEAVEITPPGCTVLSNVTGMPHEPNAASIKRRLVEQLTAPVRWAECASWIAANALGDGVTPHELAPGKTLAGLMRRIDRGVKITPHDTPSAAASA